MPTVLQIFPLPDRPGLRLVGEVDVATVAALEEALAAFPGPGDDVYVDASELTFVDVSGVTALVLGASRLGPGRHLVVCDPPRMLRRIVEVLWGTDHALVLPDSAA